jgi:hypothetical protein
MKSGRSSLPCLKDIESNAPVGAATTSMRAGWEVATEAGLLSSQQYASLMARQAAVIDRELASGECTQDARGTLTHMLADYGRELIAVAG